MVLDMLQLLLQVIWAIMVTNVLCTKELLHHFIWPRKQKKLTEKVIVVTGAGHGLGRRIACEFGKLGAKVICWDCDEERNENTVWDIRHSNGKAVPIVCDITDRLEVFRAVDTIRETVGEIDILVNCVGVYPVQPTLAWTPQELYALFDTNVMGQFWLLQAVAPHMLTRGEGHIAVISSAAAIAPVPNELPYSVTKSAITGLMDGFLREIQQQGHANIKVSCIHPYYTAVRDDIPVKFDLRFPRLSPDFVAGEIVKGIREEQAVISVPRFLLFWINFMKLLPLSARERWREIFYTRVHPNDNTPEMLAPDGTKLNIVDLYKLPPLNNNKTEERLCKTTPIHLMVHNNNNKSDEGTNDVKNERNSETTTERGVDNEAFSVERF